MAIIKHISSKNANYENAIDYLTKQYDEKLNKPILDENGFLQEREEYKITYFNSSGEENSIEDWTKDCIKTNLKYKKNREKNEIKSHQYVLAFEDDDNLSVDEIHELTKIFALEHFPGHQILVGTHPGHGHIIINSVRDQEREIEDEWMMKYDSGNLKEKVCRWEYAAGLKHHCGDDYLNHLKKCTMDFCISRGLNQVDLFKEPEKKKKDNEYHSEKRAEEKGKITYKEYVRRVIDAGKSKCKTLDEFHKYLNANNVEYTKRGSSNNYKTTQGKQWIREKSLGAGYVMDAIVKALEENYKRNRGVIEEYERIELERAIEIAKEEGAFSLPTHTNKKGIQYQVRLYNDDGTRKTALECVMVLAIVMITGEIPEHELPRWQQHQIMRENVKIRNRMIIANDKINELKAAIEIAQQMHIDTVADLQRLLNTPGIDMEDRIKLVRLKKSVVNALNAQYCTDEKVVNKQKGLDSRTQKGDTKEKKKSTGKNRENLEK